MANSISTPFPYFAGLDGDALEGGKIYIGVDGLDAKTNPKAVYYDRAQTELAAQPVRTVSGYPARTGSAAQLFADGAYSISVYTSADVLVFSSLSESGDIATLDAAISANAASIAGVSASLGTVAVEDFTDNDDLSVFQDNVGTRGNAKAYVDTAIASSVSAIVETGIMAPSINSTSGMTPGGAASVSGSYVSIDGFCTIYNMAFNMDTTEAIVVGDRIAIDVPTLPIGPSVYRYTRVGEFSVFLQNSGSISVPSNIASGVIIFVRNSLVRRVYLVVTSVVGAPTWAAPGDAKMILS